MVHSVILCGDSGARFQPLSRETCTEQFADLKDGGTLFKAAPDGPFPDRAGMTRRRLPLLSVVLASQDAGAALRFTLDSLFAQDCRDVIQGAENAFSDIAVVPRALFPEGGSCKPERKS